MRRTQEQLYLQEDGYQPIDQLCLAAGLALPSVTECGGQEVLQAPALLSPCRQCQTGALNACTPWCALAAPHAARQSSATGC